MKKGDKVTVANTTYSGKGVVEGKSHPRQIPSKPRI